MSKCLPAVRFKGLDPAKISIDKYGDSSSRGCILEVDRESSTDLHELHNGYNYDYKYNINMVINIIY